MSNDDPDEPLAGIPVNSLLSTVSEWHYFISGFSLGVVAGIVAGIAAVVTLHQRHRRHIARRRGEA